jgi:hypothetical protein
MNVKRCACVCVFAITAAFPGASNAGSLHGSLDGYVSGTITMGTWDDNGNLSYEDNDIKNVPATLSFDMEPSDYPQIPYVIDFSFFGYELSTSEPSDTTSYIHYGTPESPGASAGGSVLFEQYREDAGGSFEIDDPTGLYIASGGAADPIGVTASADWYSSGGSGSGTFIAFEELYFHGEGPKLPTTTPSVPEPSSLLLLVAGCPGLALLGRRLLP